jgi:hypothetical protein
MAMHAPSSVKSHGASEQRAESLFAERYEARRSVNGGYIRHPPRQLNEKFGFAWSVSMFAALARTSSLPSSAYANFRCHRGPTGCPMAMRGGVNVRVMPPNKRFEFARVARPTRKGEAPLLAAQPQR